MCSITPPPFAFIVALSLFCIWVESVLFDFLATVGEEGCVDVGKKRKEKHKEREKHVGMQLNVVHR
jgi:hypothetical protein